MYLWVSDKPGVDFLAAVQASILVSMSASVPSNTQIPYTICQTSEIGRIRKTHAKNPSSKSPNAPEPTPAPIRCRVARSRQGLLTLSRAETVSQQPTVHWEFWGTRVGGNGTCRLAGCCEGRLRCPGVLPRSRGCVVVVSLSTSSQCRLISMLRSNMLPPRSRAMCKSHKKTILRCYSR